MQYELSVKRKWFGLKLPASRICVKEYTTFSPLSSNMPSNYFGYSEASSWLGSLFHLWLLELPKHTTLLLWGSCLETRGHWGWASAVLGWTPVKSLWLQGMGCTPQGWQSFTVTLCMSEFTSKADAEPATSFHLDFQRLLHHTAKWAI